MKKANFVNLITIVSLLILSVMTLIAIYATAPDSSVLLLDENFSVLDENKWKVDVSECNEDGEQYHYEMGDEENRLTANGVLLIQSNFTNTQIRRKRETVSRCIPCINTRNSSADCLAAKLQTRNVFNASCGRIEVRAKLRSQNLIRFYIKITTNQNNSETEQRLENFLQSSNQTSNNNLTEFEISFETALNTAVIKSAITDDEFHIYEINWDTEKISLNIDKEKIDEKYLVSQNDSKTEISNKTEEFKNAPNNESFHITIHVDLQGTEPLNLESSADKNESLKNPVYYDQQEKNVFEMDYIRLFRILN